MEAQKRTYKTVKSLSGSAKVYRKWSDWEIGDTLIGVYESSATDQYKNNCYNLKVIEAFFKDNSGLNLEGRTITLNHNGMLDKAMQSLEVGTMIQVEYCGKSMIEKGKYAGKEAHSVKVDVVVSDEDEGDVDAL